MYKLREYQYLINNEMSKYDTEILKLQTSHIDIFSLEENTIFSNTSLPLMIASTFIVNRADDFLNTDDSLDNTDM